MLNKLSIPFAFPEAYHKPLPINPKTILSDFFQWCGTTHEAKPCQSSARAIALNASLN